MSNHNKKTYLVPSQTWQTKLEIRRSRFLSFCTNACNRQLAEEFIKQIRAQHPKANHVCWAYIAGSPDTTIRSMSDDGEPSGTAGMPILKVLEHSGYGDIVVAVVRYFGGIKLGTGGLQRAYSEAVSQVLDDLPVQRKVSRTRLELVHDYSYDSPIKRLLDHYDVEIITQDYGEKITICIALAIEEEETLKKELQNITGGNIELIQPD